MQNGKGETVRVGAQTIPWGETIRENLPEILHVLGSLGYAGAEIGVRHFDQARPDFYRDLFAENGLTPLAVHTGGTFWDPDQAAREIAGMSGAIAFARDVGFQYFALSGNQGETPESMVSAARAYERIGRECSDHGLQLLYHNHDWEFANDSATLKALLGETTVENVKLLPDVAWMDRAGVNVPAFLSAHADRLGYLHFKDRVGEDFCELGRGTVALDPILAAVRESALEWVVVEQDSTETTPEQSLGISAEYLRRAGVL
jgi:sugar phosphate isomerase/epimerase